MQHVHWQNYLVATVAGPDNRFIRPSREHAACEPVEDIAFLAHAEVELVLEVAEELGESATWSRG